MIFFEGEEKIKNDLSKIKNVFFFSKKFFFAATLKKKFRVNFFEKIGAKIVKKCGRAKKCFFVNLEYVWGCVRVCECA